MIVYNLYRLDDKNRLSLIDNNTSLTELCKIHRIPDKDVSFAMKVCNGEYSYNNFLLKAERKTLDNKSGN